LKYTAHLLRHTVKKCPQRIKDTPAVLFYRIPCIYTVYFKRLTEGLFRTATDGGGSMQQRCFCAAETRVQKYTRMYTSGQAIFKRLTEWPFPQPHFSAVFDRYA